MSCRIVYGIAGAALIGFGIACANYTKPSTLEHHQEWSRENGLPAPSAAILYVGVASAAVGGFMLALTSRSKCAPTSE